MRLVDLPPAFKRLTQLGFPRRFPIVQFPNLPLIVGIGGGLVAGSVHGSAHDYVSSAAFLGMMVWACGELVDGVNWFRRLLGLTFVIVTVVNLAHALRD